jgi:hypothetical protein
VGLEFPSRRRRAAERERVLAAAGTALLAAPDAAAVRQVAAAATAELLGLAAPVPQTTPAVADALVPDEARAALDSLRVQVTLALERADLAAELARRASVDPLTGLANRAVQRLDFEAACAGPSSASSSRSATSRWSSWPAAAWPGWRRWSAGTIPTGAWSCRASSSPWPRTPA